jgi:hypothetical protein
MEKITYDQLPPIARMLADVLNRIVENESNLGHVDDCRTGTEPAFSRDVERCPFCADPQDGGRPLGRDRVARGTKTTTDVTEAEAKASGSARRSLMYNPTWRMRVVRVDAGVQVVVEETP